MKNGSDKPNLRFIKRSTERKSVVFVTKVRACYHTSRGLAMFTVGGLKYSNIDLLLVVVFCLIQP